MSERVLRKQAFQDARDGNPFKLPADDHSITETRVQSAFVGIKNQRYVMASAGNKQSTINAHTLTPDKAHPMIVQRLRSLAFRGAPTPRPNGSRQTAWMLDASRLARLVIVVMAFVQGMGCPRTQAVLLESVRQLGTANSDIGHSVSVDGFGDVYITGETWGDLGGTNAGSDDAFLAKYDATGSLLWTRQLGSAGYEISRGVAADALGNVYIAGWTTGDLGGPSTNSGDAFLAKYDTTGILQWTRKLGTPKGEDCFGVSTDGFGNVYITGETNGNLGGSFSNGSLDSFLAKYDAAGNLQWATQLGNSNLVKSHSVSADGLGNVYISGLVGGNLGGSYAGKGDVFLAKYDATGSLQWTRQLGTSEAEQGYSISADGLGNVYISGATWGNLAGTNAGGNGDAFLAKYDARGSVRWTRQLGTSGDDQGFGVSADALGNAYIFGRTSGSLGGAYIGGNNDAFVAKYNATGNLQWTRQFGTSGSDVGDDGGVATDSQGNIYVSSLTDGSFGGPNAGGLYDAYIVKISDNVPEPNIAALAGIGIFHLFAGRLPKTRKTRTTVNQS